jgi:hypothetical protein
MIGFYTGTPSVNYCYDLDTVTLRQVTNTNFYVDAEGDGTFELYDSVVGTIEEISAIIDNEPIETNTVAPVDLNLI